MGRIYNEQSIWETRNGVGKARQKMIKKRNSSLVTDIYKRQPSERAKENEQDADQWHTKEND